MSMSYIDESKKLWRTDAEQPTTNDLKLGCLQRIATACESMAKEHDQLVRARENYERWYKQEQARTRWLARSNAALRGVITRMKNAAPEVKP